MVFYEDKEHGFRELFDPDTGMYLRGEQDDGADPFMRDFPALMDIGIMGHCIHGQMGLCQKSGIDCYQNGMLTACRNMALEDYQKLIDEAAGKCFQVALGGRGDPDMHEHFEDILKYTRAHGIVPNFTTSGLGMTKEKAEICKKYCGAVAVSSYSRLDYVYAVVPENSDIKPVYYLEPARYYSTEHVEDSRDEAFYQDYAGNKLSWHEGWIELEQQKILFYRDRPRVKEGFRLVKVFFESRDYTNHAVKMLTDAGVQTNIHFVISNATIGEAITRLTYDLFPKTVHAIVFLLYKPVGQGTRKNVLDINDPKVISFFRLIDRYKGVFQIGFDSCSIPGILSFCKNIDPRSTDSCEGARYSMYVTSDMVALPCSFDNVEQKWAFDLKPNRTIKEAWESEQFRRFRAHHEQSCPDCPNRKECRGGCPICPEIVLCSSRNRTILKMI